MGGSGLWNPNLADRSEHFLYLMDVLQILERALKKHLEGEILLAKLELDSLSYWILFLSYFFIIAV